jgi:hypothetical protein
MPVYNRSLCCKSELKTKIPSIDYESSWDVVTAHATSWLCNVITSPVLSAQKQNITWKQMNGESNVYRLLRHTSASVTTNREVTWVPEHSALLQPRCSVGPKQDVIWALKPEIHVNNYLRYKMFLYSHEKCSSAHCCKSYQAVRWQQEPI